MKFKHPKLANINLINSLPNLIAKLDLFSYNKEIITL